MLFSKRKKPHIGSVPDDNVYTESSICTGETIIGFKNARGELERAEAVRSWTDVESFYAKYDLIMGADAKERIILKNSKHGFTLVELIGALTIAGIISAVSIPALSGYIDSSREKQCRVNCDILAQALVAQLDMERTMNTYGSSGTLSEAYISELGTEANNNYDENDDIVNWIINNGLCDELICPSNGHHYRYNGDDHVFTCGEHQSSGSGENLSVTTGQSGYSLSLSHGAGSTAAPTASPYVSVVTQPTATPTAVPASSQVAVADLSIPIVGDGDMWISYSRKTTWSSYYYPLGHNAIGFMIDEAPPTIDDLIPQLEITLPMRNPYTGEISSGWNHQFDLPDTSIHFSCPSYTPTTAGVYEVSITTDKLYPYGDGEGYYYCQGEGTLYIYIYNYQSLTYTSTDGVKVTFDEVVPWVYLQLICDDTDQGYGLPETYITEYKGIYYVFLQDFRFVPEKYFNIGIDFYTLTPESEQNFGSNAGQLNTVLYDHTYITTDSNNNYIWNVDIPRWTPVYVNSTNPSETSGRTVDIFCYKNDSEPYKYQYDSAYWARNYMPSYVIS